MKQWFSLSKNVEVVDKLRSYGVWPVSSRKQISQGKAFFGLIFVITGTLKDFTRQGIKSYIIQYGGKVSDNISSKTDYLILGQNPGSKLEKAKNIGIKIINETELQKMAEVET